MLLPTYGDEVRAVITDLLDEAEIEVIRGAAYERIEGQAPDIRVHLTVAGAERVVRGDALLVATPIPRLRGHLEAAGILVGDRHQPLFDAHLRASNPRVYVAGDVTLGNSSMSKPMKASRRAMCWRRPHPSRGRSGGGTGGHVYPTRLG